MNFISEIKMKAGVTPTFKNSNVDNNQKPALKPIERPLLLKPPSA